MPDTVVAPYPKALAGIALERHPGARPALSRAPLLALAWAFCFLLASSSPAAATTLEITPAFMNLGSLSTLDPIDNQLMSGTTTISIQSDQDWGFEVRLAGPIRLVGGSLALPLERALETHPIVPPEVLNLEPHVLRSGQGDASTQEFARDWLELQSILQEYLTAGDPPGTYEFTILSRLLDTNGAPLTDLVPLTVQFDILPWVDLAEVQLPDFRIPLADGASEGESWLVPVTLRTNTGWQLLVAGPGPLPRQDGVIEFDLSKLSACAEDFSGPSQVIRSGCASLSTEPSLVAEGSAPPPFSVATVDIPLKFRFQGDAVIPVGTYGVEVSFRVRTVVRPP
jgi:hypothetical protein